MQKKRTKKIVQVASRAVGNVTLEAILAKRNQKPEFRRVQREQAIKAAKDAARALKNEKKAANKLLKVHFLFYLMVSDYLFAFNAMNSNAEKVK